MYSFTLCFQDIKCDKACPCHGMPNWSHEKKHSYEKSWEDSDAWGDSDWNDSWEKYGKKQEI